MRIGRRINTPSTAIFCSIFLSLNTVSPLYTFINSASDILQFNAIRFGMIISIIANNCCIERSLRIRTICLDNNFTIYNRAMVCYERACLSRRSKSIQKAYLSISSYNTILHFNVVIYHITCIICANDRNHTRTSRSKRYRNRFYIYIRISELQVVNCKSTFVDTDKCSIVIARMSITCYTAARRRQNATSNFQITDSIARTINDQSSTLRNFNRCPNTSERNVIGQRNFRYRCII